MAGEQPSDQAGNLAASWHSSSVDHCASAAGSYDGTPAPYGAGLRDHRSSAP